MMAKIGVPVKDNSGTVQTMLYENGVVTGLQQVVEVYSVSGSITPGVGAAHLGKAEDAVHASGDVGVMALAVRSDAIASSSSASGDYEPIHLTAQGAVWMTPTPTTNGGVSFTRVISAATTNATLIKSTAGNLYSVWVANTSASTRYLKIYNMTTAPTVGTSTPAITIPLPAGFCGDFNVGAHGVTFATGISIAITAGYADTDTAAIVAGEVIVTVLYK